MDENLILDENSPELINLFMGDIVYQAVESQWYEKLQTEGNNQFRFLHIINEEGQVFLSEEQNNSFFKYINAIQTDRLKMDKDGFAILNLANHKGISWKNINSMLSPKTCIFWGVNPYQFGFETRKYNILKRNDISMIYIDEMTTVMQSPALKGNLWALTKQLFDF